MVRVLVFDHAIMREFAVLTARTNNRNLFFEFNKSFEYRLGAVEFGKRRLDVGRSF